MSQAQGSKGRIVIDAETSFKSDPTTKDPKLVHFISESLRLSRNLISSNTIRGSRTGGKPVRGNVEVGGDITVELQSYISRLLWGLMGSVKTNNKEISAGSFSGTFVPGETITGSPSGASGILIWTDGSTTLYYINTGTAFASGDTITGSTSSATCSASAGEAASSSPYAHRFVVGGSLPSFVIEKGFTDITQYFKYNGCKVNSMSFDVTPEGFQEVTFNLLGAKETPSSSPYNAGTYTDLTKKSFDGFSVSTLEIRDETSSLISAKVTTISGFSIENNLDGSVYVIDPSNPGERASLPAGIVKVSGTLTAMFEDLNLYNQAVNYDETSLKIKWQLGNGNGSLGNEWMQFYIPELILGQNAPVISGPTGVVVELPFEAYYEDADVGSDLEILSFNTEDYAYTDTSKI
jgi:hypothetical protein